MNGYGTSHYIDNGCILEASRYGSRDQALALRKSLRDLLRAIEDVHGLPHSFQIKGELSQREIDEQRRKR